MPNNHCVLITVKLFFHEWNPYFFTCQHCFQIMVLSILSMHNPQPGGGGGGGQMADGGGSGSPDFK